MFTKTTSEKDKLPVTENQNFTLRYIVDYFSGCRKRSVAFFIFDNSLYYQTDGLGMGSPLGPTLANAFLCHYEKKWLNSCRIEFNKRQVDNILSCLSLAIVSKSLLILWMQNILNLNTSFNFKVEDKSSLSIFWHKNYQKHSKLITWNINL